MEPADLEHMLFGSYVSQNSLEDTLSDFSEDDFLFAPVEDNSSLSLPHNSPVPTGVAIEDSDDAKGNLATRNRSKTNLTLASPRDRYSTICLAIYHRLIS